MAENLCDSQLAGDGASVLRSGCPEGDEDIVARVIAFGERDRADGLRHVGVGDAEEAVGELKWRMGAVRPPRWSGRLVVWRPKRLGGLTPAARRNHSANISQLILHRLAIEGK